MGISVFPIPSAGGGGKTSYTTTLNSGTSYTVPSGVNYLVVRTIGAGGGGGGATQGNDGLANGGTGGDTTFTGATTASGGPGGSTINSGWNNGGGFGGTTTAPAKKGAGGWGGWQQNVYTPNSSGPCFGQRGSDGDEQVSIVNTSPGATINYSIGSGGNFGTGNTGSGMYGRTGAAGQIQITYWL